VAPEMLHPRASTVLMARPENTAPLPVRRWG